MRRQKMKQKKSKRKPDSVRRFINCFPACLIILAFTLPVLAAEGPGEKLAGGIEKTATGWTEVPKEMAETTEETNVVEGVTVGTVKGTGKAVVETAEGVVESATFFIPDAAPAE